MKRLLKQLAPPLLKRIVKYKSGEGWHGDYSSWEQAKKLTTGYESENIINRVRAAALKVKRGEAAYERSAIAYDKASIDLPLLSALLYAALQSNNRLVVLDYGGSLGSVYFQHRRFLKKISLLRWCIVEQPTFAEVGKQEFENEHLRFFSSVRECMENYEPDIVLFSSSLQYLPDPFNVLKDLFQYEIPYFFVDRIAFLERETDRLTIQKVPPAYYEASYPCWFFSKSKFLNFMSDHYELVEEFKEEIFLQLGLQQVRYEGMWFEKKIY